MKLKIHKIRIFPCLIITLFMTTVFLSSVLLAKAENLRSDSYIIQFGNFNITAGRKGSESYNLTDTVGQTGAGPFGQYGSSSYFVGSGFQYIYQIENFNFKISDLNIDLGLLTPGIHNTDTNQISITTRGGGGYKIYAYELHPLKHETGLVQIDDTTCDNNDCDETQAGAWVNENIPGFGFNIDGNHVPSDFLNTNYFRQFADNSLNEDAQIVMSSNNIANNEIGTITYKAGVSGSLASGKYQTGIVFIAVPGF